MRETGITDKTWFLINGYLEKAVTPDEAEFIKQAIKPNGNPNQRLPDHVETADGTLIPRLGLKILNSTDYEAYYHTKRGDWKCKYGTWHDRLTASRDCQCHMQVRNTFVPPEDPPDTRTPEEKEAMRKRLDAMREDLARKLGRNPSKDLTTETNPDTIGETEK